MSYGVSEIARTAGITVRTMHHYDKIGLVSPSHRSSAGYREYEDEDLKRLQEVLFYRELGFSLEDIQTLLELPEASRGATLGSQRALLKTRIAHLELMVDSIDTATNADKKGTPMDKNDLLEVFGDFDPAEYEEEAEERFGDRYRETARRTAKYTKQDWIAIKSESSLIEKSLAKLMSDGTPADSEQATELAEQFRLHTNKWFYPIDKAQHAVHAKIYVDDPRFAEHYNSIATGLNVYVRDAIVANSSLS